MKFTQLTCIVSILSSRNLTVGEQAGLQMISVTTVGGHLLLLRDFGSLLLWLCHMASCFETHVRVLGFVEYNETTFDLVA